MTDNSICSNVADDAHEELVVVEPVIRAEIVSKVRLGARRGGAGVRGWLSHNPRLSMGLRWLCLFSGLMLLVLLAISRALSPSPLGQGTHQQLGLPPCSVMLLWEIPCPACGMTTSWALATRGRFVEAASTNVGGLMLAMIAIAFLPASWYFFATGRATRGYWFSTLLTICLVTALASAIVQWLVRLLS